MKPIRSDPSARRVKPKLSGRAHKLSPSVPSLTSCPSSIQAPLKACSPLTLRSVLPLPLVQAALSTCVRSTFSPALSGHCPWMAPRATFPLLPSEVADIPTSEFLEAGSHAVLFLLLLPSPTGVLHPCLWRSKGLANQDKNTQVLTLRSQGCWLVCNLASLFKNCQATTELSKE
jgi:hypothetical protein